MLGQRTLSVLVMVAAVLSPRWAAADHHEAGEVEATIHAFYQEIQAAEFEKAFSRFALGASGYLPFGVLREIPTEEIRQAVIAAYSEEFEEGDLRLTPQYIKVTTHGPVALATFLVQGRVLQLEDDEQRQVVQRVSMVWQSTDSGWKIVHYHVSFSDDQVGEDD